MSQNGRTLTSFLSLLSAVTFLLLIPGDSCIDIIGGNEAYPHSRPYMAFITQENCVCGGVLIQEDWVVTAAHCATEKGTTTVILGAHSLSKKEPEQQIMTVKEQFPHPHYNLSTNEGDLKLLQLNGKSKITNAVKLLNLPKRGKYIKHGTTCQAAGWGRMTNGLETIPDTLREVNVTIIDREICRDEYSFLHFVGPNMICAGDPNGGKGTCGGDSGGPLICEDTFVSITSFGPEKCGDPNLPGVYTFLSTEYLNWIRNTIKGVV